jgi:Cof subfamily protein (haloacid dehalogenase superfamily)
MDPNRLPLLTATGTARGQRPRLVAIDIDHTLIRSDRTLAPATIDAVREARNASIEIVLASSRPPRGMWPFLRDLRLTAPTPFVGFQGAVVGTFNRVGVFASVAQHPLALADARAATAAARSLSIATSWYTPDNWFVDEDSKGIKREATIVGIAPRVMDLKHADAPVKLLFIVERPERLHELQRRLPRTVTAETSNPAYLEVTAQGVDKATGVAMVASRADIPMSEVIAIGDGRNDLGLFARVGTSVAPANSDPTVLAAADYITASNDDDGVAKTLRWLVTLPRESC